MTIDDRRRHADPDGRITITNEGEVSANGVVVTDQLPRGTAFV